MPLVVQVKEVLDAMHSDAAKGEMASEKEFVLRVDGGAAVNNLLVQLQVGWGGRHDGWCFHELNSHAGGCRGRHGGNAS